MKKIGLLFLSFYVFHTPLVSQNNYWQQQVNFVIDVTLNDVEHTLEGFEKIEYTNNSPDSLFFLWFHVWPNAFKNDKTAFSDQQIENGSTKFYFSGREDRGYINRLDFRIDNEPLKIEDHPQHIDIIKLVLPKPLAPGNSVTITTPFHVKLPLNFSRGGHVGQSYHITQWYPKPAVYDKYGWHPMPYLDQGEFYSEFGNYDVRITLPRNYVVAATGELQDKQEINWMKSRNESTVSDPLATPRPRPKLGEPRLPSEIFPPSSTEIKTLNYKQEMIHDFAWFADKRFLVISDTVMLDKKVVDAFVFYVDRKSSGWKNCMKFIKDALHFRSRVIAEYPYSVMSVVEAKMAFTGGMEYPTITSISPMDDDFLLEETVEHEIGHNWFQSVLASNERAFPWMDEGINTYYDLRYMDGKNFQDDLQKRKIITEIGMVNRAIDTWTNWKKDQAITTTSDSFTFINYTLIAYYKTAFWLKEIEMHVGKAKFDEGMKAYFTAWKNRHPYPEDFKRIMEEKTGNDLSAFFDAASKKETRPVFEKIRSIKLVPFFSLGDYKKNMYIGLFPAFTFSKYDGFMIGPGIHNYNLPSNKFQFLLMPLYATGSKQLNGLGKLSYTVQASNTVNKSIGLSASRFSTLKGVDSNGNKVFGGFVKLVPNIRVMFSNPDPRNRKTWWVDLRSYIISEKGFNYFLKKSDTLFYPQETEYASRVINQLTIGVDNFRRLYPYEGSLQIQQGPDFWRASFTGNQFFNYSKGNGGLNMRVFAAKFGYLGGKTSSKEFSTYVYQPKLTAVRGNEDYTYSNFFIGRNENDGGASQQVMMRDGDLKLRTDLFQGLQGRSE